MFNYSDRDISGRHGSSVSVDNLMFENMASEPEMLQQIGFSNWLVGRMAYVLAQLVPRRRYSVSHFEVRFLALSVPSTSWIINSLSFEFEGQHQESRDCAKPTAWRCDVFTSLPVTLNGVLSQQVLHT